MSEWMMKGQVGRWQMDGEYIDGWRMDGWRVGGWMNGLTDFFQSIQFAFHNNSF